jgi:predicted MFS family arabinose efflux permease
MTRISPRRFAVAMFIGQTVALVALALAASATELLVAVALFGITIGNVLMLQPLLLVEAFGTREYGRIYSVSQLLTAIGVAGGPALVGLIDEASGGYMVPYLAAAACSLVGLMILAIAGPGYGRAARAG